MFIHVESGTFVCPRLTSKPGIEYRCTQAILFAAKCPLQRPIKPRVLCSRSQL